MLAIAIVAVVGLTATVVILATDEPDTSATDKSANSAPQASALTEQERSGAPSPTRSTP
jgi:hypothetical protein